MAYKQQETNSTNSQQEKTINIYLSSLDHDLTPSMLHHSDHQELCFVKTGPGHQGGASSQCPWKRADKCQLS